VNILCGMDKRSEERAKLTRACWTGANKNAVFRADIGVVHTTEFGEPPHGYHRSHPACCQQFFPTPPSRLLQAGLVALLAIGDRHRDGTEHTVERLDALIRLHTHRTNDGEFLWRGDVTCLLERV